MKEGLEYSVARKDANPSKTYSKSSSAPVNIPYKGETRFYGDDGSSWRDDEEDDEIVPPHEYIARRAQLSSVSGSQGIARKLKGRDLSQLRNYVLRNTGFLET